MAALVLRKRKKWAEEQMADKVGRFTEEELLDIANECGLFDCLTYTEDMSGFEFDMTDLQMICFASALLSVLEAKR